MKVLLAIIFTIGLLGCATNNNLPSSTGESNSSFSYIPLDPLPVVVKSKDCATGQVTAPILDSLPDQAVRMAVGRFDDSGSLVFGPATVGYENQTYQVILDYISADTKSITVYISRVVAGKPGARNYNASVFDKTIIEKTQYKVHRNDVSNSESVVIPVYLGIGLRLTATIKVLKGRANLSSLGAIAAEAEAGRIVGSMVVQTLGITGKSISAALPLPSELNETTVQNAILSLGAIKAVLHDKQNTIITPRVVGIYNPIGGGQEVVNGLISQLSSKPIDWELGCRVTD